MHRQFGALSVLCQLRQSISLPNLLEHRKANQARDWVGKSQKIPAYPNQRIPKIQIVRKSKIKSLFSDQYETK